MKIKSLILTLFVMFATGSANATTVATAAGAVARANAQVAHHTEQEHAANGAIYSVNNALDNKNMVLVPCKPKSIGGLFENSRIDRELTIEECDDEKKKFERLNGVKYRFGKAVSHDRYNGYFYFELIEIED